MRYRPARTVPGTNRPSSIGNGGTSWLALAGFTSSVINAVSAGVNSRGAAHQEQNRSFVLSLLHAGHSMDIDRASFCQRGVFNTNVGEIANAAAPIAYHVHRCACVIVGQALSADEGNCVAGM